MSKASVLKIDDSEIEFIADQLANCADDMEMDEFCNHIARETNLSFHQSKIIWRAFIE